MRSRPRRCGDPGWGGLADRQAPDRPGLVRLVAPARPEAAVGGSAVGHPRHRWPATAAQEITTSPATI